MLRVFASASNRARLQAAGRFVAGFAPGTEVLLVGMSREGLDDFVRAQVPGAATFGLHRLSWMQLVAHLCATRLAARGLAPATPLGTEAVATRATAAARESHEIPRLVRASSTPGFPRAIATTLDDLRQAGVRLDAAAEADLAPIQRRYEAALDGARIADRAAMLGIAVESLRGEEHQTLRTMPMLLLDLRVVTALERDLVRALVAASADALATAPAGDVTSLTALQETAGADPPAKPGRRSRKSQADAEPASTDATSLDRLRRYLFAAETPPAGAPDAHVAFFSAPGEGRECVEIAREILRAAARGVPFDAMAVFLRAPEIYSTFLDTAFRRADVPAYFARGTKRPDPAGRAFLALLACKSEGLSAKRFAEYLSFGQVPALEPGGAPPEGREVWTAPQNDLFGAEVAPAALQAKGVEPGEIGSAVQLTLWDLDPTPGSRRAPKMRRAKRALSAPAAPRADAPELPRAMQEALPAQAAPHAPKAPRTAEDALGAVEPAAAADSDAEPALAGTLRTPWKWEELLVEAAVIGGRDRWRRRLRGLERELQLKIAALRDVEPESPRLVALQRDLTNLGHLERFAFPVIETLDGYPRSATWGEWVERLTQLAPRVLRRPERVLAMLAEMQPMAEVGPVTIDEVREVLTDRLAHLELDPPAHRYGRVFVGTPDQARGRSFRIVFLPGLAERVFPQRPREDPLLLDAARVRISPQLALQEDRIEAERLLLRLAIGAAEESAVLSYPRLDAVEARPRVPSFYALDMARAVRGSIPDYQDLEREAAALAQARLAWPAPPDAADAIDPVEHDLAVLGPLLHATASGGDGAAGPATRGRARYLLLNPTLARSLRTRLLRWRPQWVPEDGFVRTTPASAEPLAAQRPNARPYSATALQKFAACPYQFALSAIHRLEPRHEAVPLVQMDPLTRGRLFHQVQAETLRSLSERRVELQSDAIAASEPILDETLDRIALEYQDDLAPAILRVWEDEVEAMRGDLRLWLRRLAAQAEEWLPLYWEFGFGLGPLDAGGNAYRTPGAAVPVRGAAARARDATSAGNVGTAEPVTLPGGWRLRGAVDLIEARRSDRTLRVTDHKTGAHRPPAGAIVGGGEVLQPVLYALAVQEILQRPVTAGRLFFCTTRGGFAEHVIPLENFAKHYAEVALSTIDECIGLGFLPPMPRTGACVFCDFRRVCGPHEEMRSARKPRSKRLDDLRELP